MASTSKASKMSASLARSTSVAPSKKSKQRVITPNGKDSTTLTSLGRRMAVDKDIVDELLLVCGVIGTASNEGDELVPVTDCLNWLQDLQRALRRDEDLYRPISLLIGKWKVVEQKLLPLVMTCRYDTPMVLTVIKILVILTKPLSENTQRAGRMVIDTKSPKSNPAVVQQQIQLRDNALEQAQILMDYKRAVVASHSKNNSSDNDNNGLLSIFVSLLAEPLSKSGAARTDTDHLTIELVLHFFRNLLAAEPLLNSTYQVLLYCIHQ
jgi:timeless